MKARIKNPAISLPGAYEALQKLGASRELRHAGEPDNRIFTLAAWREAPYFTDAERAALTLTEAVTRLADRPDAVPDEVWAEAARHYNEPQLAALVVSIATINAWNRLNVATGQPSGDYVEQLIEGAKAATQS
jgi:alkylhydroperoxidase family enzyme